MTLFSKVATLVNDANKAGVKLILKGEGLAIRSAHGEVPASLKQRLKDNKDYIIAWLKSQSVQQSAEVAGIERKNQKKAPLSLTQNRLWVQSLVFNNGAYNMPLALKIDGVLCLASVESALEQIITRHEILRTVIKTDQGEYYQQVLEHQAVKVKQVEVCPENRENLDQDLEQMVFEDAFRPFDLSNELMIRVTWFDLTAARDEATGILLFNLHHIASDGWSMELLIEEFVALYQASASGISPNLPELPLQYSDYAIWQDELVKSGALQPQLEFWKKQLAEIPAIHNLPLDYERPSIKQHIGKHVSLFVEAEQKNKLVELARQHGLSLFMLIHAALAHVLSRHSFSSEVVIGTPVAGRVEPKLTSLIGFFVNTLILRTRTDQDTLVEYLAHIKQTHLAAQANQEVPFAMLLEQYQGQRSQQYTPLVQIDFSMRPVTQGKSFSLPDLTIDMYEDAHVPVKFDLDISAEERDDGLVFDWVYDHSLFSQEHVQTLAQHTINVLYEWTQATENLSLASTKMLSAAELKTLQQAQPVLSNEEVLGQSQPGELIHEVFESQAELQDTAIALTFQEQSISYRQLNEQANQLARYIRQETLVSANGGLVGICLERGINLIVSMMAILKAGAAYVPMDPNYPEDRLNYIANDAKPITIISDSSLRDKLSCCESNKIWLDQCDLSGFSRSNLSQERQDSSSLSYVIYTSGSTGKPKGVMQTHNAVTRLFKSTADYYQFGATDVWTLFHSICFDFSVWEIFGALLHGGQLIISTEECIKDPNLFARLCEQHEVSVLNQTPGAFLLFSQSLSLRKPPVQQNLALASLRWIIFGGEALRLEHIKHWYETFPDNNAVLVNMYGITETAVHATLHELDPKEFSSSVIGKSLSDLSMYILDKLQRLQPQGCVGELYIGGPGLAKGYLNRPELTRERFIDNAVFKGPSGSCRLYRTGDLVRMNCDGNLEYVGRIDSQVKVRGYRIELGEIENALGQCSSVKNCVVVAEPLDNKLVAYVQPAASKQDEPKEKTLATKGNSWQNQVTGELKAVLPDYMLPTQIFLIEEWPLTVNGKVDKAKLIEQTRPEQAVSGRQATTPTEKKLADIYSSLLNIEKTDFDVHSDFFQLGGHSLLAIKMVNEIRNVFSAEVSVKTIFEVPSVEKLASEIAVAKGLLRNPIEKADSPDGLFTLSYPQYRLWFLDKLKGSSEEYNMPLALEVSGEFSVKLAEQAMGRVIERHESLRTIYLQDGEHAFQQILANYEFRIRCLLRPTNLKKGDSIQQGIEALVREDALTPFDLSKDLMVRLSWLEFETLEHETDAQAVRGILIFNMHHIASDGWSMENLLREFTLQYRAVKAGQMDPLPALDIQYKDYAVWQRDWLNSGTVAKQIEYWRAQLDGVPTMHELPLDYSRPAQKQHRGDLVSSTIPLKEVDTLKHLAESHGMTLFMLLHSAFSLVLSRHSQGMDIVTGTPVAGRLHEELEPLIGFFVNTLVLRINMHFEDISDYYAHVRQVHLDAQSNQDIPFDHLVELLQVPRSVQHTPLVQVYFNFNNTEQQPLSVEGCAFSVRDSYVHQAKFDLDVTVVESDTELGIHWVYDTSLFSETRIKRMSEHMRNLLQAMAQKPTGKLAGLQMLSAQEYLSLMNPLGLDSAAFSQPNYGLLHEWFEAGASSYPEATALVFEEQRMSYAQLNARANQLAAYLKAQGVGPEVLVGIGMSRSPALLVSILAVLKAGGAYVPLDPDYPAERLAYMISDTGLQHLLTTSKEAHVWSDIREVEAIILDDPDFAVRVAQYSEQNLGRIVGQDAQSLAYVIYTSGSTGKPKGVMVEQQSLVHLAFTHVEKYQLNVKSKVLQYASISFDTSISEWVPALVSGSQLHLISPEKRNDIEQLEVFLVSHGITHATFTPSALKYLNPELDYAFKRLIVAGEAISEELASQWCRKYYMINAYGPSEFTVCSHMGVIEPEQPVNIGQPLPRTLSLILDKNNQPVPAGCPGELCLGGIGLSRGYLGRADLTAEKFNTITMAGGKEVTIYHTGDKVCDRGKGKLTYLGRIDSQIKIAGARVELEEVESCLIQVTGSAHVAVVDFGEPKRLYGFVADTKGVTESEIKNQLSFLVPMHCIPAAIFHISEIPVTGNGKRDNVLLRKKVEQHLDAQAVKDQTFANEEERQLAKMWEELLTQSNITRNANFFALGGSSVFAIKLLNRLQNDFGIDIHLKSIFIYPTVAELACHIKSQKSKVNEHYKLFEQNDELEEFEF